MNSESFASFTMQFVLCILIFQDMFLFGLGVNGLHQGKYLMVISGNQEPVNLFL